MNNNFGNKAAKVGEDMLMHGMTALGEVAIQGAADALRGLFGGGNTTQRLVATASADDFKAMMLEACQKVTHHRPHFPDDSGCFLTMPTKTREVKVMALLFQGKLIVKTAPLNIPINEVPEGFGNYLSLRNANHGGNGAWGLREAGRMVEVSFVINEHWSGLTVNDISTMLVTVSREFAEAMSRF